MPENGQVHPGSFVGDSVEEFKKLPTWGKVGVGLVFVIVAYIAYQKFSQGQASSAPSNTGTSGINPGGSSGATIGNVPVIPSGYQSVYNPTTGVLEGYQPTPPNPTPTAPGGLQGGNPPVAGPVPGINTGLLGGTAPSGQNFAFGQKVTSGGQTYLVGPGSQGRIWGVPIQPGQNLSFQQWQNTPIAQGQKTLLYGSTGGGVSTIYSKSGGPSITQPGGRNAPTQAPSTRANFARTAQPPEGTQITPAIKSAHVTVHGMRGE